MDFRDAVGILSKASPFAVATERDELQKNVLEDVKKYLYIHMPIEHDVIQALEKLSTGKRKVIFLCGSSGDGKSEILTRCKNKYDSGIKFHLDATHSFKPSEDAIQTLNKLFGEFELSDESLVVGINRGMLENYAEEGENLLFKTAIKTYFRNGEDDDTICFINFEDYPKFTIDSEGYTSEFAEQVLARLTSQSNNIIRQLYEAHRTNYTDDDSRILQANYELISLPEVQKVLVSLLFKARLIRDQFLTVRALLDFVHSILSGPGYLFDNLFSGGDNELSNKIVDFDPAHIRTKQLDRFILANDLGLPDSEFESFKESLSAIGINPLSNSYSYLRLFYVIQGASVGNDFHKTFVADFNDTLIDAYIRIFQLHRDYDETPEHRTKLKDFYNNILRAAVRNYNNRNAPNLENSHILISVLNGYQLIAELDVKADLKAIKSTKPKSPSSFTACLKVNDQSLTVPVNINLLGLMMKIVDGYRPNKHDKNTVVLLDELLEEIMRVANSVDTLHIMKGNKHYRIKNGEDDLEVNGI